MPSTKISQAKMVHIVETQPHLLERIVLEHPQYEGTFTLKDLKENPEKYPHFDSEEAPENDNNLGSNNPGKSDDKNDPSVTLGGSLDPNPGKAKESEEKVVEPVTSEENDSTSKNAKSDETDKTAGEEVIDAKDSNSEDKKPEVKLTLNDAKAFARDLYDAAHKIQIDTKLTALKAAVEAEEPFAEKAKALKVSISELPGLGKIDVKYGFDKDEEEQCLTAAKGSYCKSGFKKTKDLRDEEKVSNWIKQFYNTDSSSKPLADAKAAYCIAVEEFARIKGSAELNIQSFTKDQVCSQIQTDFSESNAYKTLCVDLDWTQFDSFSC